MKKITMVSMIFLISIFEAKSQNLQVGFGLGTGTAYMYENSDSNVHISYALPFSSYLDFKYSRPDSYFGVKLKFQYLNTGIEGENWKNFNQTIDGDVTSISSLVLLEHLKEENKWNFGYNFGFGYTNQVFRQDLINLSPLVESNFMSVNISGIISSQLNDSFAIRVEPTLFWTDPVGSFRQTDKWQIAGEDLSLLIQLGVTYKIM